MAYERVCNSALKLITKSQKITGVAYILTLSVRGSTLDFRI